MNRQERNHWQDEPLEPPRVRGGPCPASPRPSGMTEEYAITYLRAVWAMAEKAP